MRIIYSTKINVSICQRTNKGDIDVAENFDNIDEAISFLEQYNEELE